MVNPGSFRGSRFDFMVSQKPEWKRAVEEETTKDVLLLIQNRYFRRYPVDLPHDVEPTAEHLASVDDDAPDAEINTLELTDQMVVPKTGHAPQRRGDVIRFRKEQIHRWLEYQYAKEHSLSKKKTGPDNPFSILLCKLTGRNPEKPRKRSAINTWRATPGPSEEIEKHFKTEIDQALAKNKPIPGKEHLSRRAAIAQKLFKKLSKAEQDQWEAQSLRDAEKAKEEHERAMNGPLPTDPESRQRAINCLPQFLLPILDFVSEATGWNTTAIIGGPEPALGGHLNVMSIHSGTTAGDIPMNFGQSERERYKEYIVPVFGRFLKKTFTPAQCRSRALPRDSGLLPLSMLEPENDNDPHALGENPNTFVHPIDTSTTLWNPATNTYIDVSMTDNDDAENPFPITCLENGSLWPPSHDDSPGPSSPAVSACETPEPESGNVAALDPVLLAQSAFPEPSDGLAIKPWSSFSPDEANTIIRSAIAALPVSFTSTLPSVTNPSPPAPSTATPIDAASTSSAIPMVVDSDMNGNSPANSTILNPTAISTPASSNSVLQPHTIFDRPRPRPTMITKAVHNPSVPPMRLNDVVITDPAHLPPHPNIEVPTTVTPAPATVSDVGSTTSSHVHSTSRKRKQDADLHLPDDVEGGSSNKRMRKKSEKALALESVVQRKKGAVKGNGIAKSPESVSDGTTALPTQAAKRGRGRPKKTAN